MQKWLKKKKKNASVLGYADHILFFNTNSQ